MNHSNFIHRPILALCALSLSTASAATIQYTGSWSPNVVIPDDDSNGVVSTQNVVADFRTIGSVTVNFTTTGGWNGDMYAYLVHDSGFSVLLNRPGKSTLLPDGSDNGGFTVTFSDLSASDIHTDPSGSGTVTGSWQPDGRITDPWSVLDTDARTAMLNSFLGLDPSGTWTLFVADTAGGDQATLTNWGLSILAPDSLDIVSETETFSNTKNAYNGPVNVSGGGTLQVTATGTMTAMTQININGATLLLTGSGIERINDGIGEAPLSLLNGGKLALNGTAITESFGTLTVTGGGILVFGTGVGRINFAASNGQAWSGLLSIWNWNGSTDQLYVGNSATGLTETQLASVRFYSDGGSTLIDSGRLLSDGSLVPIPEASVLVMPSLLMLGIAWRRPSRARRRLPA